MCIVGISIGSIVGISENYGNNLGGYLLRAQEMETFPWEIAQKSGLRKRLTPAKKKTVDYLEGSPGQHPRGALPSSFCVAKEGLHLTPQSYKEGIVSRDLRVENVQPFRGEQRAQAPEPS